MYRAWLGCGGLLGGHGANVAAWAEDEQLDASPACQVHLEGLLQAGLADNVVLTVAVGAQICSCSA